MRRLTATNRQLGFTLVEQLVVLVIIGVLGSLGAPSFFGMQQRGKVTEAANTFRSAMEEVQRIAIMKSKSCFIDLPASGSSNSIEPVLSSDCFVMGDRTLTEVKITHNYSEAFPENRLIFDFKGNNTTEDNDSSPSMFLEGVIIFEHKDNPNIQKCAFISQPLGLIRLGDYNETTNNCEAVQN